MFSTFRSLLCSFITAYLFELELNQVKLIRNCFIAKQLMITFIIFEVIKSNECVIFSSFLLYTIMIFFKIKQILFLL